MNGSFGFDIEGDCIHVCFFEYEYYLHVRFFNGFKLNIEHRQLVRLWMFTKESRE